jgi:hypothetical protein
MARYGLDYYGVAAYGSENSAAIQFNASPFLAKSVGYQRIQLTWAPPTGDWSRIRVVRNTYGFPLSVDDGTVISDEPKNFSTGLFIDDGEIPNGIGLKEASGYHYGLFLLSTQTGAWINAGNAVGISTKNFNSFTRMYDAIPAVYKSTNLITVTDNDNNSDLENFLKIFAVGYDEYKTSANLLLNTYDTSVAYAPIIPVMMQQFGIAYEPELGLQQSRILLRNAVLINKSKGSLDGVKNFIKAFSGYDEKTILGKNLMLNYNDSSFEESIGNWESVYRATLSVALPAELVAYSEPNALALFPNKITGSLKVVAELISTPPSQYIGADIEFACGLSAPKTKGIPVKEGFSYTFSIFTQASTTARNVVVDIRWFDRNAEEISRAGESEETNVVSSWATRISTTNVAPVNAYFAIPYVRIEGVTEGEVHYFDAAQLEQSSEGPTTFEEARTIKITLKASRVNEFKNSSFELNTNFWTIENATMTRDLLIKDESNNSDVSLRLEATANDQVILSYTDFADVLPGFWYSFTGYLRTAFIGAREEDYLGGWGVDWYDANQTFISNSESLPQNLTEFYEVIEYSRTNGILTVFTVDTTSLVQGQDVRLLGFPEINLDGDYEVLNASGRFFQISSIGENINLIEAPSDTFVQDLQLNFTRNSFSTLSPLNASYGKPYFFWANALSGETLHIDSAMFERATIAKPYFDGSTGFSSIADLIWEGGVHESRSHYYKNRVATQIRLIEQLPNYLTNGTTFEVDLAQPGL